MTRLVIETADALDDLPVHDAWFDVREMQHDHVRATVLLRFAVEPFAADLEARSTLLRKGRFSRDYRTAYDDWTATVFDVENVHADDDWADMGMLLGVSFDPATNELVVESNGLCRLRVARLRIEAINHGPRWMRRRVNLLGLTSVAPL